MKFAKEILQKRKSLKHVIYDEHVMYRRDVIHIPDFGSWRARRGVGLSPLRSEVTYEKNVIYAENVI